MASKLIWGILGGVAVGALLGTVFGGTPISIAICVAAGAFAAYAWHAMEEHGAR